VPALHLVAPGCDTWRLFDVLLSPELALHAKPDAENLTFLKAGRR